MTLGKMFTTVCSCVAYKTHDSMAKVNVTIRPKIKYCLFPLPRPTRKKRPDPKYFIAETKIVFFLFGTNQLRLKYINLSTKMLCSDRISSTLWKCALGFVFSENRLANMADFCMVTSLKICSREICVFLGSIFFTRITNLYISVN